MIEIRWFRKREGERKRKRRDRKETERPSKKQEYGYEIISERILSERKHR